MAVKQPVPCSTAPVAAAASTSLLLRLRNSPKGWVDGQLEHSHARRPREAKCFVDVAARQEIRYVVIDGRDPVVGDVKSHGSRTLLPVLEHQVEQLGAWAAEFGVVLGRGVVREAGNVGSLVAFGASVADKGEDGHVSDLRLEDVDGVLQELLLSPSADNVAEDVVDHGPRSPS